MPGQSDIVSHGQQNTSLCSALLYESGLKPSLATTTAKASERVIADPLGQDDAGEGTRCGLFSALRKRRVDADWRQGVGPCDRGPSGLG